MKLPLKWSERDPSPKQSRQYLNSKHSVSSIQHVLVHGVVKFLELVKLSKLDKNDPNYKPLHCPRQFDMFNRKLQKMLAKSGWYSDDDVFGKLSWRKSVPKGWEGSKPAQFKVKNMKYSTLMQVPSTQGSRLFKMLCKAEPRLAKLTGYHVRLEKGENRYLSVSVKTSLMQDVAEQIVSRA